MNFQTPPQLEKLIEKNYYLHKSAQEAYKSYVRAYDSHSLKQIYSVNTLNLPMVALSFGFKVPPYVDLSILCIACMCALMWGFCSVCVLDLASFRRPQQQRRKASEERRRRRLWLPKDQERAEIQDL